MERYLFVLLLLARLLSAFRGRAGPPPLPHSSSEEEEVVLPPLPPNITVPTENPPVTRATTTSKPYIPEDILPVTGCPRAAKFGTGPPSSCSEKPRDPLKKPASAIEKWFSKDIFKDLFPFANLGWGPHECWPYSYEAFIIAARYFPEFGTSSPNNVYTPEQNHRRDLASFFAHAVQETGENNADLYTRLPAKEAHDCFYRGGFYNWFEGGPISSFLHPKAPGYQPQHGNVCAANGRYCAESAELDFWYGCSRQKADVRTNTTVKNREEFYKGCYFGRGAIQISYNYNYGMFQDWLATQGIHVDLLTNPNLVMTKMDPPLAILASLWFYMTPQPPKPAMHDIVMGDWNCGEKNRAAGYYGPIFGPTSLVINNECGGEDKEDPGGPGESRRIKAFRWFCKYFAVPVGEEKTLSCKGMPVKLDGLRYNLSWQPDWANTWKAEKPCDCAPAPYGGMLPYYDADFMPARFHSLNAANHKRCVKSIYAKPEIYGLNPKTSPCLKHTPKLQ